MKGRMVAVDISWAMLDGGSRDPRSGRSRDRVAGRRCVVRDLFSDKAFDLILCQQGLQFFSDRNRRAAGDAAGVGSWRPPRYQRLATAGLDRHPLYNALFQATASHLGAPVSAFDVSFSLGDAEELQALLEGSRISAHNRNIAIAGNPPPLLLSFLCNLPLLARQRPSLLLFRWMFQSVKLSSKLLLASSVLLFPPIYKKENWCFRCTPI